MKVFFQHEDDSIIINGDISVRVIEINGGEVVLAIEAPAWMEGRSNHSPMHRPFRAGIRFPPLPRALPWAGIMRAFGPPHPD
ncbi:MAG: carbon storage regulator [Planctomycetota bacterium]